jgi:hypothetical protein
VNSAREQESRERDPLEKSRMAFLHLNAFRQYYYHRRDPGEARVASPFRLYAPEVIFVGGGPVFGAVGCALVYIFVFG